MKSNEKTRLLDLGCVVLAVLLSGCATRPPGSADLQEFDATSTLAALNSTAGGLQPGVFYERRGNGSIPILDILGIKPLYEDGAWIKQANDDKPASFLLARRNIGRPEVGCEELSWWDRHVKRTRCDVATPVNVIMHYTKTKRDVLLNPATLVEILNRPLTQLSYNLEAETRILTWHSSLAAALQSQRGTTDTEVSLCLARRLTSDAIVEVSGLMTPQDAEKFAAELMERSMLRIEAGVATSDVNDSHFFRVAGPVVLNLDYRHVVLADHVGASRISFALAGTHRQSVGALTGEVSAP